jgi:hypothetical protein
MKATERDADWNGYYQESLKTQSPNDAERLADSIWMFRVRSAQVNQEAKRTKVIAKVVPSKVRKVTTSNARCVCC